MIENCPLKSRKTPDTSYYIRLKYPEENVINQIFDEVILFEIEMDKYESLALSTKTWRFNYHQSIDHGQISAAVYSL